MRIILYKPCCIGDVIFTTALLTALRRGYPEATIDWAVGSSALAALRDHPDIHALIDTGAAANPAARPRDLWSVIQALRAGRYDLAVVPDRSPLAGLATLLAGIPRRVGLDSAGRGIAYTLRAPITPSDIRHEAEIYLDLARLMGLSTANCWVNVVPGPEAVATAEAIMASLSGPPIIVHPGGGINAGMTMLQKRWPAPNFAALADHLADALQAPIAMIGAATDSASCEGFLAQVRHPVVDLRSRRLALPAIAALAARSAFYMGNDNGVGHLAAAAGARVIMIFGPSDPRRYSPFVPDDRALAAWRPVPLPAEGVSARPPLDFDWNRDGISVEEVWERVRARWGL
ncbi:MAG TPA: glycosyltransferase family 9 protein [Aggregatilineaceae bacterium]|nr:glycosyltransferase family 9 protein [Aggregatilineaceae bacterium]